VQLERYNPLSVAEIEVYGYWGFTQGVGRVSFAQAGRDVTVAVVRPSTDPRDIEYLYKRAAYADSLNADILKQLETYTMEYDKYGRGEVLGKQCVICKGLDKCEACLLYETYAKEIESMPPVIGGRRRRLNSISEYLISSNKPALDPVVVPASKRPTRWALRKQAVMDTFTFLNYFKSKRKNYVTPKEALEADPEQLMTKLKFASMIDERKMAAINNAAILSGTAHGDSSTIQDNQLDSVVDESIAFSGSASVDRRARGGGKKGAGAGDSLESDSVLKAVRHGYTVNNKRMDVGDVLPTGHVVKEAFPRSIAAQLQESYLAQEQMEREAQAKLNAVGSKKGKKKRVDLSKM
jgi:hypothetical protein